MPFKKIMPRNPSPDNGVDVAQPPEFALLTKDQRDLLVDGILANRLSKLN